MTKSTNLVEDIENEKENYGTFTTTSTYGVMMVEDLPAIDNYSKWTVKILEHPGNGIIGLCVSESDRARAINYNAY